MRYGLCVLLCLTGLICTTGAGAQSQSNQSPSNPTLTARVGGIDDEQKVRPLRLADLNVDVQLVGQIARTTVRAMFSNSTGELLEGDFSLALPDDAVVTGYALDVNGQMLDGVLSEPQHVRAQYEKQIRRKVDPGLAEVSRANVFRTRVYPIDAEKGRTIRVTFVAPIHATAGWVLPLSLNQRVGRVDIKLRAEGVSSAPAFVLPGPFEAEWRAEGNAFVAQATATRVQLSGELRLAPPSPSAALITTTHSSGARFFQLSDEFPVLAAARPAPTRLRIYWDRSRSRQDDALDQEIDLIRSYLLTTKPAAIDVVLFNSSGAQVETRTNADSVRDLLKGVTYRGATSFAVLASITPPAASLCLMMSDGAVTIDARDAFKPGCELIAVTSAPDADAGYLALITGRPTSDVLRLDRASADELLTRLTTLSPAILDMTDSTGAPVSFTMLRSARGRVVATGEAPASGEILVRMSGTTARGAERRYSLGTASIPFDGSGALWAANRVTQLAAIDEHEKMVSLSRRYSVSSPSMSFVVFETPQQYVEARLAPPQRYPKAWRAEYLEYKAETERQRKDELAGRREAMISAWREQKEWWNTTFEAREESKAKRDLQIRAGASPPAAQLAPPPPADATGAEEAVISATRTRSNSFDSASPISMLQEVSVTGAARVPSGARIELEPWNVKRPYILALNAAPPDQVTRVLSEQEKRYGALPAFYLDVAEWFRQHGRKAEAIELTLTALELPSRNDETLSVVADRMLRYEQVDRAIWLDEQLVKLEPDRPQPRRALALALAKRSAGSSDASAAKDLERAVTLLKEVIMTPWEDAYDGIELIACMEANQLMPRLRKLGVKKAILDPALVAKMDVDVRVVIEWNTAATDIDLWIDEPDGERAMYSNPKTAIGGRLSNDMTAGFGPEEYLLRRAPRGDFKVKVNVYNVDTLNPNGATTVTARVIHDFGRPSQREELLDLELSPDVDSSGGLLLGKVSFAPRSLSDSYAP
jgi:hypothetical protein